MRGVAVILTVLLFSIAGLTGCISNAEEKQKGNGVLEEIVSNENNYNCFEFEGHERCWLTYIPEGINESSEAPLILELHGWSFSSFEQRNLSDITDLADDVGAIVLHPEGLSFPDSGASGPGEESWNAGACCGDAAVLDINDSGFLIELIQKTIEELPIDKNRVYLTGWSNGCMMSQRLALEASHLIAAVACTSGYLGYDDLSNYVPIPILEMHGFLDEVALYTNSARIALFEEDSRNIEAIQTGATENLYDWASNNGCNGILPDVNNPGVVYSVQSFTSCENGTEVTLITVHGGAHNLYGNNADANGYPLPGNQGLYDTNQIFWDFMSKYSKDSLEGVE